MGSSEVSFGAEWKEGVSFTLYFPEKANAASATIAAPIAVVNIIIITII